MPQNTTPAERSDLTGTQTELYSSIEPIRLPPSKFTVQLVLDNREIRAKTDRDYIQEELMKKGIKPIMRSLELGDALWVAKCNDPETLSRYDEEGDEVVLDWIVERKRLDDLIGSIKDGRFHEQKVSYCPPIEQLDELTLPVVSASKIRDQERHLYN